MVLSVGCTAVGLVLAIGFYDPGRPVTVNTQAGSLLGLLLLVICVFGLLVQGTQTIVIDPATRCITVTDKTLFGSKRREIKFQEIGAIHIGYLGKTSNFVRNYYLSLRLKNGEDYSLFAPGRFYKGARTGRSWKAGRTPAKVHRGRVRREFRIARDENSLAFKAVPELVDAVKFNSSVRAKGCTRAARKGQNGKISANAANK